MKHRLLLAGYRRLYVWLASIMQVAVTGDHEDDLQELEPTKVVDMFVYTSHSRIS